MTEVIATAATCDICFVTAVASTAAVLCRCQLAAVKFTDGRSGQPIAEELGSGLNGTYATRGSAIQT